MLVDRRPAAFQSRTGTPRITRETSGPRGPQRLDACPITRGRSGLAEETQFVSGVSGRYASALFALAQERVETAAVAEALKTFDGLIVESTDLQRLVQSPVFSAEEQTRAVGAILDQAGIGGIAANFIRLVASIVSAAIERRIQETDLHRLAYVDNLTNLPNRAHFMRVLEQAVTGNGPPFALHFIDLDGFKMLNDLAGHAIGDLALHEAAQRLQSLCREPDTPARLGGDEFVVLQAETGKREDALALGMRLLDRLRAPYLLEKKTFRLGASVGIALYPADGTDADSLMRHADAALFRAKRTGGLRVELHAEGLTPTS